MNIWTKQSIEFAQQRNYLDELFKVYPLNVNLRHDSEAMRNPQKNYSK